MASAPNWPGWENEFLDAAQVLRTDGARQFLSDWNAHANTACSNNPLDLIEPVGGSTNCADSGYGVGPTQRYTTHGNAAHAFDVQLHRNASKALLAAITGGNPYHASDPAAVVSSLEHWGSERFAKYYFNQTLAVTQHLRAPGALGGWKALRKSINRGMPDALSYSHRTTTATLRSLGSARKVRL